MAEVKLESPFPIYAVPRVWKWIEEFRDRVADDYSPKTLPEFVADWERREGAGRKTWAVIRDEELGGVIMATRLSPIVADAHCIFKRSFWGRETTLQALRMAFDELFQGGILKISSIAFRDNHSLLGIVNRLGGKKEGVLEAHTLSGGKPVDLVLIGIPKEGFYGKFAEPIQRAERDRVRRVEQHHQHVEQHQPVGQRNEHQQAKPDAVPVVASGAALQLHHERDAESAGDRPAVPSASK